MATSLIEALAALALQGLILGVLSSTLTLAATASRHASAAFEAAADLRRIEHLVDRACLLAGAGPDRSPGLVGVGARELVLVADLDGDGAIDSHSSERTKLEIRSSSRDGASLVHWIGAQSMTLARGLDRDAVFTPADSEGRRTHDAIAVRSIEVPLGPHTIIAALPLPP